jgi:hypothetical protein
MKITPGFFDSIISRSGSLVSTSIHDHHQKWTATAKA